MIEWSVRSVETPAVESLFRSAEINGGICLFSSGTEEDREYTGINPVIILTEKELTSGKKTEAVSDPLAVLDGLIEKYSYLPAEASILGYLSYDFKDRLEEKGLYERREQGLFPDLYFAVYEHYIISRRGSDHADICTLDFPFPYDSSAPLAADESPSSGPRKEKKRYRTRYRGTSLDKKAHMEAVSRTVDYIRRGDIYQANITRAIYGETDLTVPESAMALYSSNRITYGVFASLPGGQLISTSPELFFRTSGGAITASPIKGTIARGEEKEADRRNREDLLHSEKNRAELAMIVDLLRNDLSRVCLPGSVAVPEFPLLMTLENVYHLYADVKGRLIPGTGAGEILRKTFPGGSITGCPKIRACQIIDGEEPVPRGIYTGSFGKIGFNGDSVFNIMIRSLFRSGSDIIFNVGGGITILSDPEDEYEETIHKGTNIWKALQMEPIEEERYCTGD